MLADHALPAGVVFDMDGTLLDTERLARACFLQACEDVGWQVDVAVYDRCIGTTWEQTERIMRAGFAADFPYERMNARWSALYHAHIEQHPVARKPGIEALLAELAGQRVPMAIATSSRRPVVLKKLAMAGIDRYFQALVCGGETPRGKPHGEPYIAAVGQLGLSAARCWAVEDSDNGVRSAVAAGLVVFQIPDEMPPGAEVHGLGHEILPSARTLLNRLRQQ